MTNVTAGVDLGGTKIQTVIVTSGRVVGAARVPTPQTGAADVVGAIVETVKSALASAGAAPKDVSGVGIGAPGEVDGAAGVVSHSPNVPGFQEAVKLGLLVSRGLGGARVVLDNDVRVAILGEHQRGAGRPYRNLLGVFVGTGVGGGLILEGKLRRGRGAAGEIGHTIVKPGGRPCSDGRRGHLEAYAGRGRMEARALKLVKRGRKTVLFDIMKRQGRTRLSSGVWAEALARKDEMATSLVDDAVWALGVALASAQNLLDLDAIIIGGGLGDRLGKPFVERVAAAIQARLFVPDEPPRVLPTGLGDLSGAVGAAVLAEALSRSIKGRPKAREE
jgi:glucokinase